MPAFKNEKQYLPDIDEEEEEDNGGGKDKNWALGNYKIIEDCYPCGQRVSYFS